MVKIKSVKKHIAGIKNPQDEPTDWILRSDFKFDEENNPLEEIVYLGSGKIESRTLYRYDDQFRLIEKASYLENDEFAERFLYHFSDDHDYPDEIVIEYADGSKSFKKLEQKDGKYITKVIDDEGDPEGIEIRVFDHNNQLVEHTVYDEDEVIQERLTHKFEDELLIKKEEYGYDNEMISVTLFKYDEDGNQVEEKSFTEDGKLKHQRYSTYEDGLLVEDVMTDMKVRYYYDEQKRRVRSEMVDGSGNTLSFSDYEYLDNGLVSRQVSYQMGDRFAIEPNVYGRLRSSYIVTKYDYEYFE